MNDVLVSIITPCFNSEKTIEKTIQSILHQTYKNIEYIIIDGKSSDKTLDIIHKYEPLFCSRIKIVSEKDSGIYDAMNKGIKIAKGALIGIVNSDDYYENNAVELMINHMSKDECQVLYGFQRCTQNSQEVRVVLFNHSYIEKQMITHPTCFVTQKTYDDYGLFDCTYRSSADYELMLRLYYSQKVKFIPVYHIISNFELGGMSSSEVGLRETMKLKKNYGVIGRGQYLYVMLKSYIYSAIMAVKK